MLSRRLKRKGFEIVIAVDGEQGVEMASSEKPDLILMDELVNLSRNARYYCHCYLLTHFELLQSE